MVEKLLLTTVVSSMCCISYVIYSENCVIKEIEYTGSAARISFLMESGDILERVVRDSEVEFGQFQNVGCVFCT